jgi:hypothetical protein
LVLGVLSLTFGSACSSDDATPEAPNTFGVDIVEIDGAAPSTVNLHCDGTLAVTVKLSAQPDENRPFVLSPSQACGALARCGYVRLQAFSPAGDELTHIDVAAKQGVLELTKEPGDLLPEVGEIRATLYSGITDEPYLNPDQAEVTASVTPTYVVPTGCPEPSSGMGGAGGAPAAAGGAPALDAGGAGGAGGGHAPVAGAGGAPGGGGAPALGGADAGGVGGQG